MDKQEARRWAIFIFITILLSWSGLVCTSFMATGCSISDGEPPRLDCWVETYVDTTQNPIGDGVSIAIIHVKRCTVTTDPGPNVNILGPGHIPPADEM